MIAWFDSVSSCSFETWWLPDGEHHREEQEGKPDGQEYDHDGTILDEDDGCDAEQQAERKGVFFEPMDLQSLIYLFWGGGAVFSLVS